MESNHILNHHSRNTFLTSLAERLDIWSGRSSFSADSSGKEMPELAVGINNRFPVVVVVPSACLLFVVMV